MISFPSRHYKQFLTQLENRLYINLICKISILFLKIGQKHTYNFTEYKSSFNIIFDNIRDMFQM